MSRFVFKTAALIVVLSGCGGGSSKANGGSGGSTGGSEGVAGGSGGAPTAGSGGSGGSPTGGSGGWVSTGTGGIYHLRAPAEHRAQAWTCSTDRGVGGSGGAGDPILCGGAGGAADMTCTGLNAACCHYSSQLGVGSYCTADQCATDSDCGPMQICFCSGGSDACSRNSCGYAVCRTDADCGAGLYCSRSPFCGPADGIYNCHTPDDECADNADCPWDGGWPRPYCRYDDGAKHWRCNVLLIADCPA